MIQATSLSAYDEIAETGLLNELCLRVLRFISDNQNEHRFAGSISQADASRALDLNPETCDAIRPRFVELLETGVIAEVGKKVDPITDRKVLGYRLTGRLPIIPTRSKNRTYKQLLRSALGFVPPELATEIRTKLKVTS